VTTTGRLMELAAEIVVLLSLHCGLLENEIMDREMMRPVVYTL